MKTKITYLGVGLILMLVSSCSTMIQFNSQKAADPRFSGIRTVGVNTVFLANSEHLRLVDNLGRWRVNKSVIDTKGLNVLIRKALVANLKKTSDYEVIDLEDLRKFQSAFQQLRPLSGERISEIDLIIDIRVALNSQQQSGTVQEVMTFRNKKSVVKGREWVQVENSSRDKVVTVPYSNSLVDIASYVEVIKTKNGEAKVLKSFNVSLSNNLKPMTSIETMVNELAIALTGRILKNVSKYSVITTRQIDKDSDDETVALLEEAKLNKAVTKLENALSESDEREPADVYNLGICYEAFGDPALAIQMYKEAHKLDENNELYMKAIGELE
ncbi:MAG: tetratricopeptide repeat protein [Proteobacteria bacterium]|nr:tetratricopeptide repeat protein [Pseudomonadota bacterium]